MNNDCVSCKSVCCMAGMPYSAVMTESEVERLKAAVAADERLAAAVGSEDFCYFDEKIGAYKMRKFSDNRCVFWNPDTLGCLAYDARPLDCRIFPREYRWFVWMHSPQCPSKKFECKKLLSQFKDFPPDSVRKLKYLHLKTPESTRDKLWILLLRVFPVAAIYGAYAHLRGRITRTSRRRKTL